MINKPQSYFSANMLSCKALHSLWETGYHLIQTVHFMWINKMNVPSNLLSHNKRTSSKIFAHQCMTSRPISFANVCENKLFISTDFKGTDIYDDCFAHRLLQKTFQWVFSIIQFPRTIFQNCLRLSSLYFLLFTNAPHGNRHWIER